MKIVVHPSLRLPSSRISTVTRTIVRTITDRSGSTIVEFSIVAPVLFAFVIAIISTMMVFLSQQCLQTASDEVAREVLTGQVPPGQTAEQFRQSACTKLPSYMSCSNLMVNVQTASSFSSISMARPTITYDKNGNVTNTWAFDTGGAGDIVFLSLLYFWYVPTGPLGFNYNTELNGTRLLIATSVFKSEPY